MKALPKITVIIPSKNSEKTIEKTFDSLRQQTYKNFECILVDGLSTDATIDIAKKNNDVITKIISEKDNSVAEAENKGIKLASGELISYLHSDDYYEPNMLQEIVNAYLKNKKCKIFSYGLSIEKLSNRKITFLSFKKKNLELKLDNILFKHPLGHFYHKSLFKKYGYNLTKPSIGNDFYANDREFLIRLCCNDEKNFVIEKVLYRMRSHENSNTLSKKNLEVIRYQHIDIANFYMKKFLNDPIKYKKLCLFKIHNLSLLISYYMLTLRFEKLYNTFKKGYKIRKLLFFFDIILCPLSELIYRGSVRKWL